MNVPESILQQPPLPAGPHHLPQGRVLSAGVVPQHVHSGDAALVPRYGYVSMLQPDNIVPELVLALLKYGATFEMCCANVWIWDNSMVILSQETGKECTVSLC